MVDFVDDDPAQELLRGIFGNLLSGRSGLVDAAENNYRIRWKTPMSTDCPWYVHEVPTVMVSLNFTTHLHDATMVKAYINAYHDNPEAIRQVVDKITGVSAFKGTYNDTVWTEKWQAKL